VATAEGQTPIEEIREGDLVWAQDDRTGEVSLKPVKQLFVSITAALVTLHIGASTLEATPEHPLWVVDQGWKAANQIQAGDELWTWEGECIAVTAVGQKQGRFTVYNCEIGDFHSYFVGDQSLLAHNLCPTVTTIGNRISRVKAKILLSDLGTGTGTTQAARGAMEAGDDAGHIVGRQLGGKGGITSDNIFSQNPHINRGDFARHESWVAEQVRAGKNVEVDVQLHYQQGNGRVSRITYDTYVNGVLTRESFGN
jgi:hypothetical protein